MKRLAKIYRDIQNVRIQGATNIAKAAVKAYLMSPTPATKKKLISLRPTEPLMINALHYLQHMPSREVLAHFDLAQERINFFVARLLKNKHSVFTHCHSSNVVKALVYAKKQGLNFRVLNTETRPLYQGRKTSKELARAGIKVIEYVDAAVHEAVLKVDLILLGADAILTSGAINKIGSAAIAEITNIHKKPVYIVADSWKFSEHRIPIEERDFHEVWASAPKSVKVKNPAFEKVERKYIKGIISELGIFTFAQFIKKVRKQKDF
jgi:translation initiation factor 2B subunit (eIF-2B alpha/beta/delta family)